MKKIVYIFLFLINVFLLTHINHINLFGQYEKKIEIITLKRIIKNIHKDIINNIEYDLSNNFFITASNDDTVGIFNFETEENITYINNYYNNVRDLSLSKDCSLLAVVSNEGFLTILKYPELISLKKIYAHYDSASSVTFSPDGNKLISAGDDGLIKIWDVNDDFNILNIIEAHNNFITKVKVNDNMDYIITASEDNTVKIFDYSTFNLIYTIESHIDYVKAVDITPDGRYVISGDDSGQIIIFDTFIGEIIKKVIFHKDIIRDIKFNSDGKFFAVASDDRTVSVWDTKNFDLIRLYKGFSDWVYCLTFTLNDDYIIIADGDFQICILPFSDFGFNVAINDIRFIQSINNDKQLKLLYERTMSDEYLINNIAISPNNKFIATSSSNGYIELWSVNNGELIRIKRFKAHNSNINALKISYDGKYIVSSSYDKTTKIWDNNGKLKYKIKNDSYITNITFTINSTNFILTTLSGSMEIRNISKGELIFSEKMQSVITSIEFSLTGDILLIGYLNNIIELYDYPSMKILNKIELNAPIHKAIITSNNIIISTNGFVKIFNKNDLLKPIQDIQLSNNAIYLSYNIVVNSYGVVEREYLVTSNNGIIGLWIITPNGITLIKKLEIESNLLKTEFSADGKYLYVISNDDSKIRVYTLY